MSVCNRSQHLPHADSGNVKVGRFEQELIVNGTRDYSFGRVGMRILDIPITHFPL